MLTILQKQNGMALSCRPQKGLITSIREQLVAQSIQNRPPNLSFLTIPTCSRLILRAMTTFNHFLVAVPWSALVPERILLRSESILSSGASLTSQVTEKRKKASFAIHLRLTQFQKFSISDRQR